MVKKLQVLVLVLLFLDIARLIILAAGQSSFQVLSPQGIIASQERGLIIAAVLIMLLAAIPILCLGFFSAWKYRSGNTNSQYAPDWDHNTRLQAFWWAFAITIITVLSIINWVYTHRLDPRQPLDLGTKPLTIQVIAMRWKWLFIYPEQKIASVNFVEFPSQTPINFELTGDDAPMNSFWIPELGSQIYAMSGMSTQVHLMASAPGEYRGSSAEISGQGFSGMRFTAKSVTSSDFNIWVASVKRLPLQLNVDTLNALSRPSESNPPIFYALSEDNLYTKIVMKYMAASSSAPIHKISSGQAIRQMPGM